MSELMRKYSAVLLIVIFSGMFHGMAAKSLPKKQQADSLLNVLDHTIMERNVYAQARQERIDSLAEEFKKDAPIATKIKIQQSICNLYFDFQNDRAMESAETTRELAGRYYNINPDYLVIADIAMASLLRYTGQLKESSELLDRISNHKLSPNVHYQYLVARMINYAFLRDNSPSHGDYYDTMAEIYRDSVLMQPERRATLIIAVERLLKQGKSQQALTMLYEEYDYLDPSSKRAGTLAYNIALCYEAMGDTVNFKHYLTLAAIVDLRNGVRGYKSLQRLAVLMYEQGEIDRAYDYMKCSMEDAISSSARIRAHEASEMFVVIDESYRLKVARQKSEILNYLISTGIVGILLLVSLFVISLQNKKLVVAKRKLTEANMIKEGYLGVFIEEYSNHLSRMNSYRIKSAKILKKGDIEEIGAFVDEALKADDDLKEFYRKFDATILHIFPTFIEEFNMLMNDVPANGREDGREELTAERRIAAFMRLGITETAKIALFLRYSVRTVYNYRSQMRQKAKDPKNFEADIMRIGLTGKK